MGSATENMSLYITDVDNDDTMSDFFPGLNNNFDLIDSILGTMWVNVKSNEIGAVGDYSISRKEGTDDAPALQKALDIAKGSSQRVNIYIPSGTYMVGSELSIYGNTHLLCAPDVHIIKTHTRYIMINGDRGAEYPGYNGQGNITIQGGIFDGNCAEVQSKGAIFSWGHGDTLTFRDVTWKDCYSSHHIEVNSSKNVTFDNCKFIGGIYPSGADYNEAIQLDLSKGTGVFSAFGAHDNTPCTNVSIKNCYFGPSGTPGTTSPGRGIGSHSATPGRRHTKIQIDNNVFDGMLSWGIRAYNWDQFTISNNKLNSCGLGINVRTAITGVDTEDASGTQVGSEINESAVISGNIIRGGLTAGRGIELYGEQGTSGRVKGITVIGNTINASGGVNDAIITHFSEHITVANNRIYGCKSGIAVNDCYDITVNGNVIDNTSGYGVEVYGGSAYVNITGNNIRRSNSSCIYMTGIQASMIANNVLTGANGNKGAGTDNNHIRLTSGVDRVSVTGNTMRNYSTTYITDHAIYVTSSCLNIITTGNMGAGFTLYNGGKGESVHMTNSGTQTGMGTL